MKTILSVILVLFTISAKATSFRGKDFSISMTQYDAFQEINLHGEILTSNKDRLAVKRLIDLVIPHKNILFKMTSGGGYVPRFNHFAEQLNRKCDQESGCEITTMIPASSYCGSACVCLFLMGDKRIMKFGSRLGFHRMFVVSPKVFTTSVSLEIDRLRRHGVSEEWLASHEYLFADACQKNLCWIKFDEAHKGNLATGYN